MTVGYISREEFQASLDFKVTARDDAQVDRAILVGSRSADDLCQRVFYPTYATRYFDWPTLSSPTPWRLWLDQHELASVTAVVAAGVTVPLAQVLLEPSASGPPYSNLQLDLSTSPGFTAGTTWQRDIAVTGLFVGCPLDYVPITALAGAVDASVTTVAVADSSRVGVGSLLMVGSELLLVTARAQVDTTQDATLTASNADQSVTVTDGTKIKTGETLLVDSERLLVVDIAGNVVTVRRAWAGSTLAVHTATNIYAPRTLTVTRAAQGSTAASHADAAPVSLWQAPALVRTLTLAEASTTVQGELGAYAGTIGSAANPRTAMGTGLNALRDQVLSAHGRQMRVRAV
jgi:hypothetical protein